MNVYDVWSLHGKFYMLRVQKQLPDDELVCSKHVEDSIIETNEGSNVCILLVFVTYTVYCTMHGSENVQFNFLCYITFYGMVTRIWNGLCIRIRKLSCLQTQIHRLVYFTRIDLKGVRETPPHRDAKNRG
jgi:hypothetical protein